jgi:hypothetical protein
MIFEKLQKARIELQNKKLKKTGKNGYSGFTYYELADFLPQVNQIFYDLKLCSNFSIENEQASLTVTDWEDNTKEVFTSPIEDLELKGCTKIQALGGVHTYMKRYLYLNALEIVESDMLDAKAGSIEEVKTQKEQIQEVKNDNDILAGIVQCKTEEECNDYWKNNVSKLSGANTRKQLAELKKQRIEAIKEGK